MAEGSNAGGKDWLEAEIDEVEELVSSLRERSRRERRSSPPGVPTGSASDAEDELAKAMENGDVVEELVSSLRSRSRRERLSSPPGVPTTSASDAEDELAKEMETGDVEKLVSSLRSRSRRQRLSSPPDAATTSTFVAGDEAAKEMEIEEIKKLTAEHKAEMEAAEEDDKEEFSFPKLDETTQFQMPIFSSGDEAVKKAALSDEFNAETFSISFTGGGTAKNAAIEEIKKELLGNQKVLDVEGLERWLRRKEAVAELAWFTEWCADEQKRTPPLGLFESAFRALDAVKSAELHRGANDRRTCWIESVAVPEFFVCPLSKKVMKDPVVITSGKTVDRSAVEKWLEEHSRICPVTGEVLIHNIFTPNILAARCMSLWRALNHIREARTDTETPPLVTAEERAQFDQVTLLSHSSSTKQVSNAISHLRELVNEKQCSFRYLLGCNPGTIAKLVCILPETCMDPNPQLDDIILEIIAKAATYGPNKQIIGDDPYAIPVLIVRALAGPVDTRVKCAQILGLLADTYSNKIKIGELGGIAALVELLHVRDVAAKRTAARGIASLCEAHENWSKFLKDGVADAAILAGQEDGLVNEAYCIMLQLSGCEPAMVQIMEKLDKFIDDDMWKKLIESLWEAFVYSNPGRSCGDLPASSVHSEEAREVVSWLQKRCYFPRTLRYKD